MESILKEFMLLQTALEVLLLVLLAAVLWRTRSRKDSQANLDSRNTSPSLLPEELKNSLERFLTESDRISKTFEANLNDKKELSASLILKLDRRLADYRELLAKTEEAVKKGQERLLELNQGSQADLAIQTQDINQANPAAPEVRALVLQLAKKGLSVEDIAVRSKLHRGEVELIIDLENQFNV
ncbi:MAG: hypothetical protein LBP22_12620 [Deltaproteobacteria bacterium]|nr:hypothetical protein [Deltaproteobacteria bacterium]